MTSGSTLVRLREKGGCQERKLVLALKSTRRLRFTIELSAPTMTILLKSFIVINAKVYNLVHLPMGIFLNQECCLVYTVTMHLCMQLALFPVNTQLFIIQQNTV